MPAPSIRDVANPLHTVDLSADDDTDLEILREIVGDARVVCIGESAHFAAEFARLRDRITRYLVRELGFSTFVLESGLPEGLRVDDWVRGGPGGLAPVARHGITYAFGRCAEMHAQLRWMRDWNAVAGHQVGFYGMDVPGWCADPAPGVAACLDRLPARPGDRDLLAAAELAGSASPDGPGTAGLSRGIDELAARAADAGDEIAQRCAHGAQRVVEFLEHGLYPGPGRNLRNEVMAENLWWILGREDRVVVGAHNVHVQREPSFDGTAPIGRLLAPVLGAELIIIGTTRGAGIVPGLDLDAGSAGRYATPLGEFTPPAHSLDALLDTAGLPQHLVDLRHAPHELLAGATAMSGQTQLIDLDPAQAFDAVAHVRDITPVRGVPD